MSHLRHTDWGLRDYGTEPIVWDGTEDCKHEWGDENKKVVAISDKREDKHTERDVLMDGREASQGQFCQLCGAWKGNFGLEPTPELYVQHLVQIFREVKRVLRKDGVVWLNLGDSYWGGKGRSGGRDPVYQKERNDLGESLNKDYQQMTGKGKTKPSDGKHKFIKPKDLVGIPWRTAFALQKDGWWLRQDIIWSKSNPMPESVKDRCTNSHEYIFLLTKSKKYFYDADAIAEEATGYDGRKQTIMRGSPKYANGFVPNQSPQSVAVKGHERWQTRKNYGTNYGGDGTGFQNHSGYNNLENPFVRNKRSVWSINTQPFPEAHFAVFPERIPELCIKAGTSEKGRCPKCGNLWIRNISYKANYKKREVAHVPNNTQTKVDSTRWKPPSITQNGWIPTCECGQKPVSCIVLDPFSGSGTTGLVAKKLNRRCILIDLKKEYCDMSIKRLNQQILDLKNV